MLPRTIVDAGANIGLTSVFFARRFPEATILAVEPEESNHSVMLRNVAPYPNVVPIRAALWGEDAVIHVENPGLGKWGFRTRGTSREAIGTVRGMTIDTLMREHGMGYLDILKLDIEGSERKVLSASSSWIDRVGMIVAEMHDRYEGGCSRAFYKATSEFEWEWTKGENLFAVRGGMVPEALPGCAARVGGLG
jgi:FkbM family methyltransferase